MYHAETSYKKVRWELPDDYLSYEQFLASVRRLEMKSSPGIPYCREATTNGTWLKWNGVYADQTQLQRLWFDVQHVLEGKFPIQYRSFIKMEPHKMTKCELKRWRLIIAAPLSVQVAWHMLFDYMNDIEIDRAFEIPSQQGLTLMGGDWKRYYRSWLNQGLVCSLDKSAWDWSAPYWVLEMDLEFRYRMCYGHLKEQWYVMAKRLYGDMFISPTIVTTEGYVLVQKYPGIMKSGCVNTISTNSHGQVFMHILVNLMLKVDPVPMPACLGDDTLVADKHITREHIDMYKRYGVQTRAESDQMEFAGHSFHPNGPIPAYRYKHLVNLMHQPDGNVEDYVNTMMRLYVHDDEMYYFWEDLTLWLGVLAYHSREYTLCWYDMST